MECTSLVPFQRKPHFLPSAPSPTAFRKRGRIEIIFHATFTISRVCKVYCSVTVQIYDYLQNSNDVIKLTVLLSILVNLTQLDFFRAPEDTGKQLSLTFTCECKLFCGDARMRVVHMKQNLSIIKTIFRQVLDQKHPKSRYCKHLQLDNRNHRLGTHSFQSTQRFHEHFGSHLCDQLIE